MKIITRTLRTVLRVSALIRLSTTVLEIQRHKVDFLLFLKIFKVLGTPPAISLLP